MRKYILLLLCILTLALSGCGSKKDAAPADSGAEKTEQTDMKETAAEAGQAQETGEGAGESGEQADEQSEELLSGEHHIVISVKDYGDISLTLDADAAPITVTNFIGLAKSGFYDGLTFHRIMDGFMIQGGDPLGNGTGGAEKTIKGEFASNGVPNPIAHTEGVISMARSQFKDSASSQFFIMVADAAYLDGEYAAFGHVTEGLDIVKKIAADARPIDRNGTIPPEAQPVMEKITVLD